MTEIQILKKYARINEIVAFGWAVRYLLLIIKPQRINLWYKVQVQDTALPKQTRTQLSPKTDPF